MKLTAAGIKQWDDEAKANQMKRESIIMDLLAKGGHSAVARLFNSYSGDNRGYTLPWFRDKKSEEDDIEQSQLDPVVGGTYHHATSTSEESYKTQLQDNFGLDDETVARFAANGDPTVFERLYNKVIEAQQFYQEQDIAFRNTPRAEQFIGEIIASSVDTAASPSGRIDINKVEDYIGREMDGLYKAMLQQQEMPRGQIVLGEKFLGEDIDLETELKIVKMGMSRTSLEANKVLRNLDERLKLLKNIQDGVFVLPDGKPQQVEPRGLTEAEIKQQDFYLRYRQQLTNAMENFEEDEDAVALLDIFGAAGLTKYLTTKPRLMREIDGIKVNSYIHGLLEHAKNRRPILVPVIEGRPHLYPRDGATNSSRVPEEESFIYELIHGNFPVFGEGSKVATYTGDFEDAHQNIVEALRY